MRINVCFQQRPQVDRTTEIGAQSGSESSILSGLQAIKMLLRFPTIVLRLILRLQIRGRNEASLHTLLKLITLLFRDAILSLCINGYFVANACEGLVGELAHSDLHPP